jgi:glycine/D-amino acid oxidase-like deaminating enzyme
MPTNLVNGDCFFTQTNQVPRQYPYLTSDIQTDVIIVGGGVTGAILAYYFSMHNINAVIIEKARIAHGSTSITTALLQYELDSNAMDLLSATDAKNIETSYRLGLQALDELDTFIHTFGNQCAYEKVDCLLYTPKQTQIGVLKEEYLYRQNIGLPVDFLTEENNPFDFKLSAGVVSKNGGAKLDPYLLTHQLLDVSVKQGLRVYENTTATHIVYENDRVLVETGYGHKVTGNIVIAATGYQTKLFTDRNFGKKTTTFNVATKPIPQLAPLLDRYNFRDNEDPYHYFRTTKDHRLIMGGEDIDFDPDRNSEHLFPHSYDLLEQRLKEMFPHYPIEIDYRYCGAFASTKDNLGFIGKDPKHANLWYCLGYGANGILFAILGGMMLSKLYLGEVDETLKLFKPNRF